MSQGGESESESGSVVSDSLRPRGLYSPWNSPGQNTGVDSLSLLQGIFPTQGSNPGLPRCRRILYQLSHKGSPPKKAIIKPGARVAHMCRKCPPPHQNSGPGICIPAISPLAKGYSQGWGINTRTGTFYHTGSWGSIW